MTEAEELEGVLEWEEEELNDPEYWLGAWSFAAPTIDQWEREDKSAVSFFKVMQMARDIRTVGEPLPDVDYTVGAAMAHEVGWEFRVDAAAYLRGMWGYIQYYGQDAFWPYIESALEEKYPEFRRGSNYYLSLSPIALEQIMNVAYAYSRGALTLNDAVQAIVDIARAEGKSARAAYFNVYYLARTIGGPFTDLARGLARRR